MGNDEELIEQFCGALNIWLSGMDDSVLATMTDSQFDEHQAKLWNEYRNAVRVLILKAKQLA